MRFKGVVVHGKKKGRELGYPTANMKLIGKQNKALDYGIYASFCYVDGKKYKATTHVGYAETFEAKESTFEPFIHNFDQEIYGKTIEVELVKKLREILKFNSIAELVSQIEKDVNQTESLLEL